MSRGRSHVIIQVMLMVAAIAIVGTGCSESTSPENGDPYQDVPAVPKPTAPGAETGAYSDTLSVISLLATNYRPEVTDVFANWLGFYRCGHIDPGRFEWVYSDAVPYAIGNTWFSQVLLPVAMCNRTGLLDPPPVSLDEVFPWNHRLLLYQDGAIAPVVRIVPVEFVAWTGWSMLGSDRTLYILLNTLPSLSSSPHLRRDRFWVRRPLEGGAGSNFLLLIGNTQGTITTTYTSGSSTTETETFGRTVSASAGLDFGKLSLGVRVSISRTFSTSVTVSEESSESFSKTVFGEDGKIVQFQVWELVERYTITDSAGEPFTDPNYVFEPVEFHIGGVAVALDATKFDE